MYACRVCVRVCIHTHMCSRMWRPELNTGLLTQSFSHWTRSSLICLGSWPAYPGSSSAHLHRAEVTACPRAWLFIAILRAWTQVLIFAQQALYQGSYLSDPYHCVLNFTDRQGRGSSLAHAGLGLKSPCPRLQTMKGLKLKFIFDNNLVMSEVITETVIQTKALF